MMHARRTTRMKLIVVIFSLGAIFLLDRNTVASSSSRARREAVPYADPQPFVPSIFKALCKQQLKDFGSPEDYCREKSHQIVMHLSQTCYKVSKNFCSAAKMWKKEVACQLWFDRTICTMLEGSAEFDTLELSMSEDTSEPTVGESTSESTGNVTKSTNVLTEIKLQPSTFENLIYSKCQMPFEIVMRKQNVTDPEFDAQKFCKNVKKMIKSSCQATVKEYVCAVFVGIEAACKLLLPRLICF